MGIKNYHQYLRQYYKEAIENINTNKIQSYDHVYIDLNNFLHNAIHCKDKKRFFTILFTNLRYILFRVFPLKSLTIAIDGSSPYSKIILQRERRLYCTYNGEFSSLELTPGTKFMNKINDEVKRFFKSWKKKYIKLNDIEINIIDSNEPDEGEIKIFRQLKTNGKYNLGDSHCVIGNDSDLIVLAMASYPIRNIHLLYKENKIYKKISLDIILNELKERVNNIIKSNEYNIRNDFVVLSILMGNDYIKKPNYLNVNKMWNIYFKLINKTKKLLTSWGDFDIDFLTTFMLECSAIILTRYKKNIKIPCDNTTTFNVYDYLRSIKWCWKLYENAECPMYDFSYDYKTSPSPLDIYYYLKVNMNVKIDTPYSDCPPIDTKFYTLLVLNDKTIELIDDKYHDIVLNKINYMNFDNNKLKKYQKEYNDILCEIKKYKEINNTNKSPDNLKKELQQKLKKLKDFKENKYFFSSFDIKKIIDIAENY